MIEGVRIHKTYRGKDLSGDKATAHLTDAKKKCMSKASFIPKLISQRKCDHRRYIENIRKPSL